MSVSRHFYEAMVELRHKQGEKMMTKDATARQLAGLKGMNVALILAITIQYRHVIPD